MGVAANALTAIPLVSVNVGLPAPLGLRQGRQVRSAIRKTPSSAYRLRLEPEQLEGDRQADPTVHGGPDKAVFAYPLSHLQAFAAERDDAAHFAPGSIGENLTVAEFDETTVHIGDTWRWGDALVQVAQPRMPCYKLAMRTGWPGIVRTFEQRGWSGWYLRVLEPGSVPVPGPGAPVLAMLESRDEHGLTVREASTLLHRDADPARLRAANDHPTLAPSWADALRRRLASLDTAAP